MSSNLFELERVEPEKTRKIIKKLKEKGQDFEWYPTTDAMIDSIVEFLKKEKLEKDIHSIMDIGAGDGRVLIKFQDALRKKEDSFNNYLPKLYAIEKANIHQKTLIDKGISVLGDDLFCTTLFDKNKNLIFCNPPYSRYKEFMVKILEESNFDQVLIFIVPQRWRNNEEIKFIMEKRGIKEENIKTISITDFENGERAARAKVEIFAIVNSYNYSSYYTSKNIKDSKDILFDKFIFPNGKPQKKEFDQKVREREKKFYSIVDSGDEVKMLVELYQNEFNKLVTNYQKIGELDGDLFEELEINLKNIKDRFYEKIANLKNIYWQEALNKVDSIKQSLTKKSINAIWNSISYKSEMDFTEFNIRTIILHFLKEAYKYKDSQLIDFFENDLFKQENLKKFKSNQKAFDFDYSWRDGKNNNTHYYLTNKIVLKGYYVNCGYSSNYKLEMGMDILNDLRAIIRTLGYETENIDLGHNNYQPIIETNKEYLIHLKQKHPLKKGEATNIGKIEDVCFVEPENENEKGYYQYLIDGCWMHQDSVKSKKSVAIRFKGFKNGNLHININKEIMDKLNVQFARLKGWIKQPKEAEEEMGINIKTAKEAFNTPIALQVEQVNNLLGYNK